MSTREAVLGCAAKDAIDVDAGLILVVTTKGDAARIVSKYHPQVPGPLFKLRTAHGSVLFMK